MNLLLVCSENNPYLCRMIRIVKANPMGRSSLFESFQIIKERRERKRVCVCVLYRVMYTDEMKE
jgi:hypothetical protein